MEAIAGHKSTSTRAPGWLVWTALWIVYIVWGSTYLAIRVAVETLPPVLSGGVRFLIAGAVVYLFLLVKNGPEHVKLTARELRASAVVGGLLLMGGNGLVTIAETSVPSNLAALLIAAVPLWVVVIRSIARERVRAGTIGGVVVGFVGVAVLVMPGNRPDGANLAGMLLLILAAGLWAVGSFLATRLPLHKDPFVSTAAQMLTGGAIMVATGLLRGEGSGIRAEDFSAESLWALAYLVVAGSLLAFTAYVWLLQNAPLSKVSTYAYVNPVVAILLGWLILGEEITAITLIGAGVIVSSVAYIVRRESTARQAAPEAPVVRPRSAGDVGAETGAA